MKNITTLAVLAAIATPVLSSANYLAQTNDLDLSAVAPDLQGNLARVYRESLQKSGIQNRANAGLVIDAKMTILKDVTTGKGSLGLPIPIPVPIPEQLSGVFAGKREVTVGVVLTLRNQAGQELSKIENTYVAKRAEFLGVATGTTRAAIEIGFKRKVAGYLAEAKNKLQYLDQVQEQSASVEGARVGNLAAVSEDGLQMAINLKDGHGLKTGESAMLKLATGNFRDADGNLIVTGYTNLVQVNIIGVSGKTIVVQLPAAIRLKVGDTLRI